MQHQEPQAPVDSFASLRKVDVSDYIEKKNNLSYLSWAFAVDQLLQRDPSATWEYRFGIDPQTQASVPFVYIGATAMVFCTVRAFGVERTAQLPIMDYKNKAIANPDSFQTNTAMQRCLAKAIALHGLALYIYAGEDLPPEDEKPEVKPVATADEILKAKKALAECKSVVDLRKAYDALSESLKPALKEYAQALAKGLE
jgi:hypothetical protein